MTQLISLPFREALQSIVDPGTATQGLLDIDLAFKTAGKSRGSMLEGILRPWKLKKVDHKHYLVDEKVQDRFFIHPKTERVSQRSFDLWNELVNADVWPVMRLHNLNLFLPEGLNITGFNGAGRSISNCVFDRTYGSEINLRDAKMYDCGVGYPDGHEGMEWYAPDLSEAVLKNCTMDRWRAPKAFLYRTTLDNTSLKKSNLSGAHLIETIIKNGSKLHDVNLVGATIKNLALEQFLATPIVRALLQGKISTEVVDLLTEMPAKTMFWESLPIDLRKNLIDAKVVQKTGHESWEYTDDARWALLDHAATGKRYVKN